MILEYKSIPDTATWSVEGHDSRITTIGYSSVLFLSPRLPAFHIVTVNCGRSLALPSFNIFTLYYFVVVMK